MLKILVYPIVVFFFCGCLLQKKANNSSREVFLVSGGFNAAYGHVAIQMKSKTVFIDTSFYPAGSYFEFRADSAYIKKNRSFHADLKFSTEKKDIYHDLFSIDLATLKKWAIESQAIDSNYSVQDVIITQNGHCDSLVFHLKSGLSPGNERENFLSGLANIFPFSTGRCTFSRQFYLE
jgi:hypothetical protein